MAALARATIDVAAFRELFVLPILSILAMMGLAIALNLCSENRCIYSSRISVCIPPETAQLAFMVSRSDARLKLMLTYFTLFRSR